MTGLIRAPLNLDDLDSLRDFVLRVAVVEGPLVLRAIGALHRPEFLLRHSNPLTADLTASKEYKARPPRSAATTCR
jgi:hypothetical protein